MKFIKAITFVSMMLWLSCSLKSNNIQDKLIGKWVLDSTMSAKGNFYKSSDERKILIFKGEKLYSFESWNGDVENKTEGNYYLHKNPERKCSTIFFLPDLQFRGKDTIRTYMCYDIISISGSLLKVVEETKFLKRDSLSYQVFNKQYIYRLTK